MSVGQNINSPDGTLVFCFAPLPRCRPSGEKVKQSSEKCFITAQIFFRGGQAWNTNAPLLLHPLLFLRHGALHYSPEATF